ncbi:Mur ligase domain-containing protein [Planctomycetota bacterium]
MEATDLKAITDSLFKDNGDGVRLAKIVSAEGITGKVCCDSRRVNKGDVFVAVRGVEADGHDFIDEAVGRGAAVVVAEQAISAPEGVKLVQVANSAAALGYLAQAAYGRPTEQMKVLGVTGTNGKTTVAYLVREILRSAGVSCGMLGTVEYNLGDGRVIKADNTTRSTTAIATINTSPSNNPIFASLLTIAPPARFINY